MPDRDTVAGRITAKTKWPDYAENALSGLRRKPIALTGSITPKTKWPDYGDE